ncbi:MAG: hypothetical protein VST68_11685 [Nitrospirota bacterium]|nr:hypothetical protein [Nitrospirota bacterium]
MKPASAVMKNVMEGLLNISLTWPLKARDEIDISSRREWSKKHALV